MECASSTRPSKTSSNILEIVSKFAEVCRLRSVGVFSSENPNHHHRYQNPNNNNASSGEDGSDVTEETECDGEKVHPQPIEVLSKSNVSGDIEILKLFDIVSALKLAYVQLQEGHIPYDPEKIKAADEVVVNELEALCKIKRAYKEKQLARAKPDSVGLGLLQAEIKAGERLLERLKSETKAKETEILLLQRKLDELDSKNTKLVEKIRKKSLEGRNMRVLNICSFQDTFKAVSKSIHDFAKPLISLMKASGWDLDLAADSIEDSVVYSKRSHKKYAFEAYIVRRMFHGMSLKSYNVDNVMRFDDPIDALIDNPNSDFAKFCQKKYLLIVHPKMEASFFGNLDQRTFVLSGKHPRTPFYQIFARMARWVWVLQGLAASIEPKAEIFVVKRGSKFSVVHMESVEGRDSAIVSDQEQSTLKVEFMVMPGFRIGETLVKSGVYLSEMFSSCG